ncbi:hypothetical protein N3K66_004912 [Trichothecium roseum]|uniref:Uncharacterized protein n=1 Tax=Trichothecium roseum TaxID=47278 RepID=A0ACC0V403_9HYPO|nr:hypothetical protein N3K66_004912 [Trichothecium roseum]
MDPKDGEGDASQPALYVLDPFHPDAMEALAKCPGLRVVLPEEARASDYRQHADAVMLRSDTRVSAADLEACRKLKHIVKQGVGTDNIDLEAAERLGVHVYNTPGLNAEAVAELALALALSLARRVAEVDRRIRRGETVVRSQTLGKSLYGKTLGVVGMGHIGSAFARKWVGAMQGPVLAYDPSKSEEQVSSVAPGYCRQVGHMDELLGSADVISLHVPLTDSTRNLISRREFALMKSEAILLNCARGGIVNEEALADALGSGKLFGAGLDAMEVEPPTLETYGDLLDRAANLIITPHIGASTAEIQSQSGLAAVNTALAVLRGDGQGCNRVV